MGFLVSQDQVNVLLRRISEDYNIYAPKRFSGGGAYSGTDCIRYGIIHGIDEIVFDEKSHYSFKEVLLPASQTLLYFTQSEIKETEPPSKRAVIFLRSCDLHAIKRLDDMYLNNGPEDYYYRRLRNGIKIVLMGCAHSFENCFCTSMGTNRTCDYDMCIDVEDSYYRVDCKEITWMEMLRDMKCAEQHVEPRYVEDNNISVHIPENLSEKVSESSLWRDYDARCIACGRCNFVCPTCTCFTMQDILYSENGKAGERRRVMASCMVDGFTDVAGGGGYRKKNGDRMRFKVMHKVYDYKQRKGYHMCVGCGRCDDICPEYISFPNCINQLKNAMNEISGQATN